MIWIGVEDIILIHSKIIQKSGGIDGIRDRSCLESAVAAPMQSFGGQDFFPSDVEKIARLGYGLATNHAFLDGNKRIGAMMDPTSFEMERLPIRVGVWRTGRYVYCIG